MSEIFSVIYLSEEIVSFDHEMIDELVEKSQYHNQLHGITGFLYYNNGRIFQYIEGEKLKLEQLIIFKEVETLVSGQVKLQLY